MLKKHNVYKVLWLSFWICFTLFNSHGVFPFQEIPKTKIEISSQVSQTQVPLNRTLELKVTLSWIGDSDIYSVINFDNPSLTNFEIIGTSTTKRSEYIDNQTHVFNDYIYTLKPKELGMGYVEGITIKVHDNIVDREENLKTQRIPVEVVDPVPEPGETSSLWILILLIVVFLTLGVSVFLWLRKKRKMQQQKPVEPEVPIESNYLDDLRSQFNLDQPELREDFFKLSKLLRRYLTERFAVRALEATTDELVLILDGTSMEENQIKSIKEILSRSDEIKFSGTDGTLEELTRFYTLIEGMLETFLHKAEDMTKKQQK